MSKSATDIPEILGAFFWWCIQHTLTFRLLSLWFLNPRCSFKGKFSKLVQKFHQILFSTSHALVLWAYKLGLFADRILQVIVHTSPPHPRSATKRSAQTTPAVAHSAGEMPGYGISFEHPQFKQQMLLWGARPGPHSWPLHSGFHSWEFITASFGGGWLSFLSTQVALLRWELLFF